MAKTNLRRHLSTTREATARPRRERANRGHQQGALPEGEASALGELSLGALGAVEGELWGFVVGEVRVPAILVSRQPNRATLRALRDQSDGFGAHVGECNACMSQAYDGSSFLSSFSARSRSSALASAAARASSARVPRSAACF